MTSPTAVQCVCVMIPTRSRGCRSLFPALSSVAVYTRAAVAQKKCPLCSLSVRNKSGSAR